MRDVGQDVRRNQTACVKLSKTVQGLMANWTEDNFVNFQETMDLIREGAPVQWVKLYMEAVKMGIIKETNVNININRQQDHENLQALVRTRIPQLPESGTYTPYEEVKPQEYAKLMANTKSKEQ